MEQTEHDRMMRRKERIVQRRRRRRGYEQPMADWRGICLTELSRRCDKRTIYLAEDRQASQEKQETFFDCTPLRRRLTVKKNRASRKCTCRGKCNYLLDHRMGKKGLFLSFRLRDGRENRPAVKITLHKCNVTFHAEEEMNASIQTSKSLSRAPLSPASFLPKLYRELHCLPVKCKEREHVFR